MSFDPRRPSNPLVTLLLAVLVLAAAAGTWLGLRSGQPRPEEIGSLLEPVKPIVTLASAAEEKTWLEPHFRPEEGYIPAPPGPPPCPWGIDGVDRERAAGVARASGLGVAGIPELEELHKKNGGWLSGLALGRLLVEQGQRAKAESLYATLLKPGLSRPLHDIIGRGLVAAEALRDGNPREPPPIEDLTPAIYALQASGYVQILGNKTGEDFWNTLKYPIALGKMVVFHEQRMLVDKVIDGYELDLAPPGCVAGWPGISSYDLYNNLIVGYLTASGFQAPPEKRTKEFERAYQDPPLQNPLLTVLRKRQTELETNPEIEGRVWAVSNAERLLRDRLLERRGYPQNARLALAVAGVIEWALEGSVPEAAVPALLRQQRELLAVALEREDDIPEEERPGFDRALARLRLIAAGRNGEEAKLDDLAASFSPEQSEAASLVATVQAARREPAGWASLALGEMDPGLSLKLGKRASPWRSALRSDLAAALARFAAEQEPPARQRLAGMASSILHVGDTVPPALANLKTELGTVWRLRLWLHTPVGAGAAAAAVFLLGVLLARWLAVQLRVRRELFTSFYRTEAEQRLRGAR